MSELISKEKAIQLAVGVFGSIRQEWIQEILGPLPDRFTREALRTALGLNVTSNEKVVKSLGHTLAGETEFYREIGKGELHFATVRGIKSDYDTRFRRVQAEIIRGLWSKYGLYGLVLHVRPFSAKETTQEVVSRVNAVFTEKFLKALKANIVTNIANSFKSKANLSGALVVVEGNWKYATGLKTAGAWPKLSKKYKDRKGKWLSKVKAKVKKRKERGKALTGLPVGKGRKLVESAGEMGVLTGKMKKALLGIKPRLVTTARGATLVASVPINQAPHMIPFVRGRKKGKSKQPSRPITLIRKQDLSMIDDVVKEAIEHVATYFFGAKVTTIEPRTYFQRTIIRKLAQV